MEKRARRTKDKISGAFDSNEGRLQLKKKSTYGAAGATKALILETTNDTQANSFNL